MRPDLLHVVTAISNPVRYKSRYRLYNEFEKHMLDSGVKLWTIEMAFGDRPFEVTRAGNPQHFQVRGWTELWSKENLLNLAIARLPADAEYLAWIDADVSFTRKDWAEETVHQLQHHHVVQLFSHAQDLGPKHEPVGAPHIGFCYAHLHGLPHKKFYVDHHPGYAWAARRESLDHLGGLIDYAILGAADRHMAFGLTGKMDKSIEPRINHNYRKMLMDWQQRATDFIWQDIGYVPGTLNHYWHGSKQNRFYHSRWRVLIENDFDPTKDIKRDVQGLWQLDERRIKLRDDIRRYFRARNEDSIDLE